nr:1-acyl-sn-glycerol-3-phosphate acyltransferase 2-like [Tanacetum cinerariifolium]
MLSLARLRRTPSACLCLRAYPYFEPHKRSLEQISSLKRQDEIEATRLTFCNLLITHPKPEYETLTDVASDLHHCLSENNIHDTLPYQLPANPTSMRNSWNHLSCNINETMIKETIDALVSTGLAKLGYKYVNIATRGNGSLGHEEQDAKTFSSWGFVTSVSEIRSFAPAIIDITVAIPEGSTPPTMLRLFKGKSDAGGSEMGGSCRLGKGTKQEIDVKVTLHLMKYLPKSDEAVAQLDCIKNMTEGDESSIIS